MGQDSNFHVHVFIGCFLDVEAIKQLCFHWIFWMLKLERDASPMFSKTQSHQNNGKNTYQHFATSKREKSPSRRFTTLIISSLSPINTIPTRWGPRHLQWHPNVPLRISPWQRVMIYPGTPRKWDNQDSHGNHGTHIFRVPFEHGVVGLGNTKG